MTLATFMGFEAARWQANDKYKRIGYNQPNLHQTSTPSNSEGLDRKNEINLMKPFLMRHIEIVSPKILVTVGGSAAKAILDIEGGILRHRGAWKEIILPQGLVIPIIATLHPAYLLRAPNQKKLAWEDLKSIRTKLKELND